MALPAVAQDSLRGPASLHFWEKGPFPVVVESGGGVSPTTLGTAVNIKSPVGAFGPDEEPEIFHDVVVPFVCEPEVYIIRDGQLLEDLSLEIGGCDAKSEKYCYTGFFAAGFLRTA